MPVLALNRHPLSKSYHNQHTMASSSFTSIATLFALVAIASGADLFAVTAGLGSVDIGVLPRNSAGGPLRICPEDYSQGFSIRCGGNNVNPKVKFYIIETSIPRRVQSEGNAPFHIAGDRDATGEVFRWRDWETVTPKPNGNRRFKVKCMFIKNNGAEGSITRTIVVQKPGCGGTA